MPREFYIGIYTITEAQLWIGFAALVIFVIPIGLMIHGLRRRQKMKQFARELGCTYTKQQSLPGIIWRRRWRRNIIEGNWRGQKILIYDAYEHDAGSDYTDGYTMINGKKYTRRIGDYLPVEKIRRVLAGDTTIQSMNDNAKLSLFVWITGILWVGGTVAVLVYGLGIILYNVVKSIIYL